VTPKLREMSAELYGTPEQASAGLAAYTDEQLTLLIGFMRGSVAFQEEMMRRLDELVAARSAEGGEA